MKIDFTENKVAERDAPRDQLNTVCLVSSISRPVLVIDGQLVGQVLRLDPRNTLLTPVGSYNLFSSQKHPVPLSPCISPAEVQVENASL